MDWSTIFLFCVLFGDSSCSVVVVSTGEKFDAPTMKLGWDIFVLQGRVIESVPDDGCDELENHQDVRDNIVLINPCEYSDFYDRISLFTSFFAGNCLVTKKMEMAQRAGAKGAIVESESPTAGLGEYNRDYGDADHLVIGGVDLSITDGEILREKYLSVSDNVTVILRGGDSPNPWKESFESPMWWITSVYVYLVGIATIAVAVTSIVVRFRKDTVPGNDGFWARVITIPIVTLAFNIGAVFGKMLLWVDPTATRRIYTLAISTGFATTSIPFNLASVLLISFYLADVLRKDKLAVRVFLSKKMRWIAFSIIGFMFLLEWTVSIMRIVLFEGRFMIVLEGTISSLLNIAVIFYFGFTSYRVTRFLTKKGLARGSTPKEKTRNMFLSRLNLLILTSVACLIVLTAIQGTVATGVFDIPIGYLLLINGWHWTSMALTMVQVLIFWRRKGSSRNSQGTSSAPTGQELDLQSEKEKGDDKNDTKIGHFDGSDEGGDDGDGSGSSRAQEEEDIHP